MFEASLTGDFGKLTAFSNRVAAFGSPATMREVAKAIADEGLFQVQVGFSQQRDPYGPQWASKKINDGRKILRGPKGYLERSFKRFYVDSQQCVIGSKANYAGFQQTGTGIFGPKGTRIYPKHGRALKIGTGRNKRFFSSIAGSPKRLMMPTPHRNSIYWARAFQKRVSIVLRARLAGRGSGVL